MNSEAWLAIVNPHSGGQPAALPPARRVVLTSHPGHASALAAESGSYRGIYVTGGDGTIFEVLQTMDLHNQSLAVIPSGRGNSLARDLTTHPSRIDLMEVTVDHSHRYLSASTVALGYPVAVAETANRRLHFLGRHCYTAAAACKRPRRFPAHIRYADGDSRCADLTGFIANNTRHIANFRAFPAASCRDGFLDAMELGRGFPGQTLHNLCALAGIRYPASITATQRLQISLPEPQAVLIDGEIFPNVSSVEVRLLPSALHCWRHAE